MSIERISHILGVLRNIQIFEWECLPMPAGPSGYNASQMDSLLCGISKMSSKKKDGLGIFKVTLLRRNNAGKFV